MPNPLLGSLSLKVVTASCSLPQEKQKPEFLKAIPEKMKLYSEFLGKRPWFAGDKVKGGVGRRGCHPSLVSDSRALTLGFLQVTYVDFLAYDILDQYRMFEPKCLDAFPNLRDFLARFEVMP